MADVDYHGAGFGGVGDTMARAAAAFGAVPWANWAGALSTVALAGGLAVWAVDLATRDVRGVPVIQALEGPMRVAPEEPGGETAPHQGLALSEITAGGAAGAAPQTITLAPPPAAMDAPSMADRAEAVTAARAEVPSPVTDLGGKVAILAAAVEPAGGAAATEGPVVEYLRAQHVEDLRIGDPVGQGDAGGAAGAGPEALLPAAVVEAGAGAEPTRAPMSLADLIDATVAEALEVGIVRSARPPRRPEALKPRSARAAPQPAKAPAVDPTTLTPGTRLVQLGAYDSEAMARGEWARLEARFGAYLAGKGVVVQKAASGEKAFWRLRAAGFADGAEARRLCTALLAQGQPCIPVTVR